MVKIKKVELLLLLAPLFIIGISVFARADNAEACRCKNGVNCSVGCSTFDPNGLFPEGSTCSDTTISGNACVRESSALQSLSVCMIDFLGTRDCVSTDTCQISNSYKYCSERRCATYDGDSNWTTATLMNDPGTNGKSCIVTTIGRDNCANRTSGTVWDYKPQSEGGGQCITCNGMREAEICGDMGDANEENGTYFDGANCTKIGSESGKFETACNAGVSDACDEKDTDDSCGVGMRCNSSGRCISTATCDYPNADCGSGCQTCGATHHVCCNGAVAYCCSGTDETTDKNCCLGGECEGNSCDDGDATTDSDRLQADCSCAGEAPAVLTCATLGGAICGPAQNCAGGSFVAATDSSFCCVGGSCEDPIGPVPSSSGGGGGIPDMGHSTGHGNYFKYNKDIKLVFTEGAEFLLKIAGGLVLFILILGGVYYIISGASPDGQTKAKKVVTYAVIGIVIVLISYIVINQSSRIFTKVTIPAPACYWSCGNWSACMAGVQTRVCTETCGAVAGGPVVSRVCVALPASFDWRANGGDWMTSVKDQEGCGACWAFATAGYIEAMYNIQQSNLTLDVDFSEQDLVSCSSGSCSGGNPGVAMHYIKEIGIVDEPCFLYVAFNQNCAVKCGDPVSRIGTWFMSPTISQASIKEDLVNNGPVLTTMNMDTYSFGAMSCTSSSENHTVVIVGYDDLGGYWIVKNSWGAGWETDGGYFKVRYGECGIDTGIIFSAENITHP
ncbi:MAG: C1 family peptidase [Patescibacteria group bacterium]|nr:C1 family peptidase [Patescibacteria group bacterium]